ncbi:MAG: ATP-binding protein [Planctomycetota bacterium]
MRQSISRERLRKDVQLRLKESPAVVLLGARQVGKTTLATQLMEEEKQATLFDLERAASRAALESTPEATLADCEGLVVIDEVQRMPALFETLRPLCDEKKKKRRFLLLGSAAPELIRGISETLAGRVQFVNVSGLCMDEVGHQDRLWLRGGFPRAYLAETNDAAWRWLEGFRETFLQRDLPSLGVRIPAPTLARFWSMLAHYHGQIWNAAELGRVMSVQPATANHYRDILAGTYMLRVLSPWFENLGKRQVKSPKVYIRDSGILHHLLGVSDLMGLRSNPRYGASWEGFALEQILTIHGNHDAWFWSTIRGAELDLLLFRKGKRYGFEFKCTDAPTVTKSMHIATSDLKLEHLWVVYPGKEKYSMGERMTALPLSDVVMGVKALVS